MRAIIIVTCGSQCHKWLTYVHVCLLPPGGWVEDPSCDRNTWLLPQHCPLSSGDINMNTKCNQLTQW